MWTLWWIMRVAFILLSTGADRVRTHSDSRIRVGNGYRQSGFLLSIAALD